MRLLFLRGGALGDFLVTLPALAALRSRWPDARIELVGNATAAALVLDRGLFDRVHSQHEARWAGLYADELTDELKRWLREFDVVLNYFPDPARELARHFPLRSGQVFLSAPPTPAIAPAGAHFCAPLRELGIGPGDFVYPLRTASPEASLIGLHPGSGSSRKNWPADRWQTLATWLERDLHASLVIFSGEAEPVGVLAGIGRAFRSRPLGEVADQLACCRLFIGHDSGISHLAAACGTPAILLFGPTDPKVWAPPGDEIEVLHAGAEVASISIELVQSATKRFLARASANTLERPDPD
ncbi:MAG: lipopolysaccharide core biosynthesis protein [Verrucomicrobia bacterium]|nr:lipopolysaccharide core biosynthesis protein [Verrucomicrobiota bacterium]